MKVWKVVYCRDGEYFSSSAPAWLMCWYEIGEKTLPKIEGTPLMAFESLETAREWRNRDPENYSILECEAEEYEAKHHKCITLLLRQDYLYMYAVEDIKAHWESTSVGVTIISPLGTVLCKSITPLKVVGEFDR